MLEGAKLIGAGAATISLVGAAVGIGNVFSSLIQSVARKPKQLFGYAILGFALIEAIAFFALMMAFLSIVMGMSPDLLFQKVLIALGGRTFSGIFLKAGVSSFFIFVGSLVLYVFKLLIKAIFFPDEMVFAVFMEAAAPDGMEEPGSSPSGVDLNVPLFTLEERREAIRSRYSSQTFAALGESRPIPPHTEQSMIEIEEKLEKFLLNRGYSGDKIRRKWGDIREYAFPTHTDGGPMSEGGIERIYSSFLAGGIEQTTSWNRIYRAIRSSNLILEELPPLPPR